MNYRTILTGLVLLAVTALPAAAADGEYTDMDISDAVEDEFLFDPAVPYNDIDVEVTEGIVMLTGRVIAHFIHRPWIVALLQAILLYALILPQGVLFSF